MILKEVGNGSLQPSYDTICVPKKGIMLHKELRGCSCAPLLPQTPPRLQSKRTQHLWKGKFEKNILHAKNEPICRSLRNISSAGASSIHFNF